MEDFPVVDVLHRLIAPEFRSVPLHRCKLQAKHETLPPMSGRGTLVGTYQAQLHNPVPDEVFREQLSSLLCLGVQSGRLAPGIFSAMMDVSIDPTNGSNVTVNAGLPRPQTP
eukprot:1060841-Rhodomonas_salina.1